MSNTQRRACIALGSLAKHVHRIGLVNEASRLIGQLEQWLDYHNESKRFTASVRLWLEVVLFLNFIKKKTSSCIIMQLSRIPY